MAMLSNVINSQPLLKFLYSSLLGAKSAKQTAGFRSWHYDVIVIVLGVIVGIIILATIIRAFYLYRRDKFR